MYLMEERFVAGEDQLFSYLKQRTPKEGGEIGIIAGHFMLMYDASSESLVPMIWQDLKAGHTQGTAKELAGDFPVYTFGAGLRLQRVLPKENKPRIVLVVNDHLFQSPNWRLNKSRSLLDAGKLRRDFYRRPIELPPSYVEYLKTLGVSETDVIYSNDDELRDKQSTLPKKTQLFSEQALRNEFGRDTTKLLSCNYFYSQKESDGSSVMFSPWGTRDGGVCLTEDGKCGCSGEVIQLFVNLASKDVTTVINFIPEECSEAFNQGAKAALHYIGRKMNIVVITGSRTDFSKAVNGDHEVAVLFEVFSHQWNC